MAVMWPRTLPREITSSILRSTECKVYTHLCEVLDDSFVVFYSRPWLGLKPDGEEIDGECDFVVAHREYGILMLEVKGGAITYSPETEEWTTRDRWGYHHRIKNPVGQARSSKYQILKKLNASKKWMPHRIWANYGVIFPDSRDPGEKNLGAAISEGLICFLEDFDHDLEGWILERMGAVSRSGDYANRLGDDGMRALEDILAHPIHLHFPLGKMISDDDHQISVLTRQQYQILNLIQSIPRAGISGGAGTGKTVLAVEEAVRLAQSGMRVLLTCYNRPLAGAIQRMTEGTKGLVVTNFHDLCYRYAESAGIPVPEGIPEASLFNDIYPEIFIQAVSENPLLQFDAIIIDEGQDFLPQWFRALDAALDPPGHLILRIFYDNNQSVYGYETRLPERVSVIPLHLNQNLRNTQRICEVMLEYYSGSELIPAGPPGRDVEWVVASAADELRSVVDLKVRGLIEKESISPSDVAVLTDSKSRFELLAPDTRLGGVNCHRCDAPYSAGVILDTVRRFKGLERPIVILVLSREWVSSVELMYVGLSRARAHLIVVGEEKHLSAVRRYMANDKALTGESSLVNG